MECYGGQPDGMPIPRAHSVKLGFGNPTDGAEAPSSHQLLCEDCDDADFVASSEDERTDARAPRSTFCGIDMLKFLQLSKHLAPSASIKTVRICPVKWLQEFLGLLERLIFITLSRQ